jgi:hypothetical protein
MTTFFNQKEEVLNIELTPYGKQKFASGEFNPHYYAFYDTDILYDGQYGGISESQNAIVTRIKQETPRVKPLTRFTGSNQSIVAIDSADLVNQIYQVSEFNAPYYRFLGSSSPWSDYYPAWNVTLMEGSPTELKPGVTYQINNTVPMMSASNDTVYYRSGTLEQDPPFPIVNHKVETLNLDVQELNTLFKLNGNFDIEVFEQREDDTMRKLYFINQDLEDNGTLSLRQQTNPRQLSQTLEGSEEQIASAFPILDEKYVEFYLKILVDSEIEGVAMPSQSTLYRGTQDENPGDICDSLEQGYIVPTDS